MAFKDDVVAYYHLCVPVVIVASLQLQCLFLGVCPGAHSPLLFAPGVPSAIFGVSLASATLLLALALLPSPRLLHAIVSATAAASHFVLASLCLHMVATAADASAVAWTSGSSTLHATFQSPENLRAAMLALNGALAGVQLVVVLVVSCNIVIYGVQLVSYCLSKCTLVA
ncbi:hypothetical protein SPRG_04751 [Saprolegnia parasitica CBS 223.65]|uniref:Uncharacterized protein n=1 Tax=Saprolegnia parasitica (strain CBS 223.65) TaxID=695850 RepID=A0A067CNN7_SAPPC|nr:hypothetical protein SPRG_04751 [Saprolegnia parasitica CBS 223.65]KDO30850.1 hypothetical protein SPRG_04751 [Saprolegnia parasitica CBS 223.65]|eukprot:XP_012198547.1 hypothetical protein SPRG_04751 [Saprolegnia parasitica CBS 223.65]